MAVFQLHFIHIYWSYPLFIFSTSSSSIICLLLHVTRMCIYVYITYTYILNLAHKTKCDFFCHLCHPLIPTFSPLLHQSIFKVCMHLHVHTHICYTKQTNSVSEKKRIVFLSLTCLTQQDDFCSPISDNFTHFYRWMEFRLCIICSSAGRLLGLFCIWPPWIVKQ